MGQSEGKKESEREMKRLLGNTGLGRRNLGEREREGKRARRRGRNKRRETKMGRKKVSETETQI